MSPKAKTRLYGAVILACATLLVVGAPPALTAFAQGALIGAGASLVLMPETLLKKQTMAELQGFMGDFRMHNLKG